MALFHDRAGWVGGLKAGFISSGIYLANVVDCLVADPIEFAIKI